MRNLFGLKFFFNSYVKGFWQEGWLNVTYPFRKKTKPRQKFLIFTGGRTGSTLLLKMLNANEAIFCDGEILKGRMRLPEQFLDKKATLRETDNYGFKLLSYQLKNIQNRIQDKRAFLEKLVDDGYKIIYLERQDKVAQSVSVVRAMQQDHWHSTQKTAAKPAKVIFPIKRLSKMVKNIEQLTAFENEILTGLPYLYLSYENDLKPVENRAATMRKIGDFLKISLQNKEVNLQKVLPAHFSDFMENAQEIRGFQRNYESGKI